MYWRARCALVLVCACATQRPIFAPGECRPFPGMGRCLRPSCTRSLIVFRYRGRRAPVFACFTAPGRGFVAPPQVGCNAVSRSRPRAWRIFPNLIRPWTVCSRSRFVVVFAARAQCVGVPFPVSVVNRLLRHRVRTSPRYRMRAAVVPLGGRLHSVSGCPV